MVVTLTVLVSTSVTASFGDTSGAWSASHGTVDEALAAVTICKPGDNPGEHQLAGEKHALLKALQAGGAALSATDATRYQQAFAAAANSDWAGVEQAVAPIADKRLVGTLWQLRLVNPGTQPGYPELASWLQTNNDLPGADELYRQALHRKPAGTVPLAKPTLPAPVSQAAIPDYTLPGIATLAALHLEGAYSRDDRPRVTRLANAILTHLRDDAAPAALQLLRTSDSEALLTPADRAALDIRVAAGLVFGGGSQYAGAALELAEAGTTVAPTAEASWIAGLAAYRLQNYDAAWRHFVEMYNTAHDQQWSASAAAFWAARADIARGERHEAVHWLKIAAEDRATFYGMLARRALGREAGLNLQSSTLTAGQAARLNRIPAGSRALALVQIGETARAETELQRLDVSHDPELKEALLTLAETAHFARLAEQVGFGVVHQANTGSAYPIPRWKPKSGYSLDPALVYAIMRQESRFDPAAESGSGAIGLMQLMPQTAAVLTRRENVEAALREPETNIEIGQHYVQTLLADSEIDNNLVLMAVAYNGGPGNLARWKQGLQAGPNGDDPLLFMETLPAGETRGFIEQVLTNYWIYRLRLGEDTDSLTELAAGKWPHYRGPGVASKPVMVAELR